MTGANLIAWVALGGVSAALLVSLLRLIVGPTPFDRLLAGNAIAIKSALIAAGLAIAFAQSAAIDVGLALLFALIVANVAIAKFFRTHSFQPPLGGAREVTR